MTLSRIMLATLATLSFTTLHAHAQGCGCHKNKQPVVQQEEAQPTPPATLDKKNKNTDLAAPQIENSENMQESTDLS